MKNKKKIVPEEHTSNKISTGLDDDFFNELMESAKVGNEFEYKIKQALIHSDKATVIEAHDAYTQYLRKEKDHEGKPYSEKNIHMNFIQRFSSAILELIRSKDFDETKSLQYLETLDNKVRPKLFAFLLWTQDKKDGAFSILRKHTVDFTSEQYDYIHDFIKAESYHPNLPLDGQLRKEYLQQQKQEFLFYQEKSNLAHKLSEMPSKTETIKRLKL